jgi:hypothetical protein
MARKTRKYKKRRKTRRRASTNRNSERRVPSVNLCSHREIPAGSEVPSRVSPVSSALDTLTPMRKSYGEMILKKGTVLYHTSPDEFKLRTEKPMLFLTFHPSEWEGWADDYITRITLLKDVSLFFMVKDFENAKVIPLLNVLTSSSNLDKQNDKYLKCYISYLQSEQFDGWFSTIEGKPFVEIALINNPSIYSFSASEIKKRNWRNSTNVAGVFVQKYWGEQYPLYTHTFPAELILNSRFKPLIENYKQYCNNKQPNEYVFYMILINAKITYFDAPLETIRWLCNSI